MAEQNISKMTPEAVAQAVSECVDNFIAPALAKCIDAGHERRTVIAAATWALAMYATGPDERNQEHNVRLLKNQINEHLDALIGASQ